jgi:hypothetical protein
VGHADRKKINSYTEYSPSNEGLHIWIKGKKPGKRCRRKGLEIYDSERYLTVTGRHLEGTPETIEKRQKELEEVYKEHFSDDHQDGKEVEVDEFQLNAEVPLDKFNALSSNNKKFKKSWEHKRSDLSDTSLSSYDLSLATFAAYDGWTDQEIASLIISHRNKYGDPKGKANRKDYIEKTISKARSNVTKGLKDNEAVERGSLDDVKEGTREEKLCEISKRFGVPVDDVLQRGTDPETFYLIINGKDVLIGKIEEFLTQKRVRAKIAKATSKVLRIMKPSIFHELIELCLEVKTVEELPGGTIADQTTSWVAKYFGNRLGRGFFSDEDEEQEFDDSRERAEKKFREVLTHSYPVYKDGKFWLNIQEFTQWLNVSHHNVGCSTVLLRLKEIGFEHKVWSTRDGGKKIKRHYWGKAFEGSTVDEFYSR